MFPYGHTFTHFTTKTQFKSNSTFWFNSKNVSTLSIIFVLLAEVTIPYSTIPEFVNRISSQNGAITTVDDSGNDVGI